MLWKVRGFCRRFQVVLFYTVLSTHNDVLPILTVDFFIIQRFFFLLCCYFSFYVKPYEKKALNIEYDWNYLAFTAMSPNKTRTVAFYALKFCSSVFTRLFIFSIWFMLQVISLESWVNIMYYVQDAHSFWDWSYFVALIVVSKMIYAIS